MPLGKYAKGRNYNNLKTAWLGCQKNDKLLYFLSLFRMVT